MPKIKLLLILTRWMEKVNKNKILSQIKNPAEMRGFGMREMRNILFMGNSIRQTKYPLHLKLLSRLFLNTSFYYQN